VTDVVLWECNLAAVFHKVMDTAYA